MGDLLEELKAQRALIQRHLDWLDTKIQSLEKEANAPGEPPLQVIERPEEAPESLVEEKIEERDPFPPESLDTYSEPTSNQLMRAKFGCLIIFATGTLLFLFLLFGLPYLLD